MSRINLKRLDYSPNLNPLCETTSVQTRRRRVMSGRGQDLVDLKTGEIRGVAAVHTVEERDDAEFVKVFAAGVSASYDLTKTGQRVFQAILGEYQRTPMSGGYADSVELFWFGAGLGGRAIDMSEKTFQRGLKELLELRFIAPRTPSSFWVNPSLFFKGDRVLFIKEYVRKRSTKTDDRQTQLDAPGFEVSADQVN